MRYGDVLEGQKFKVKGWKFDFKKIDGMPHFIASDGEYYPSYHSVSWFFSKDIEAGPPYCDDGEQSSITVRGVEATSPKDYKRVDMLVQRDVSTKVDTILILSTDSKIAYMVPSDVVRKLLEG
jgi:hypothetical protein